VDTSGWHQQNTTITQQYEKDLLKELVHNCIAHQSYTSGGRIYFDEFEDMVIITNPGSFIPGDVRKVLKPGYNAPFTRNMLLAEAMASIKMIDSTQWGIQKVYKTLRDRYFPLPDYDFSVPNKITVTVYGKILDQNYTVLLFGRNDLEIDTIYLLDRIQKKILLEKDQYKMLKHLGLIEGKAPNVYVSLAVAEVVDGRAQYIKNKAMDDQYYMELIMQYLQKFGSATKSNIIELLRDKLSDVLNSKQKDGKVKYLLSVMKKNGIIEHKDGNQRTGVWVLIDQ